MAKKENASNPQTGTKKHSAEIPPKKITPKPKPPKK
jgi:hypothetical protein